MKIAFFSTKPYDKIWFEPMGKEYGFEIRFYEVPFHEETVTLAKGFDAVCIFVNDYVNADMIKQLYDMQVKAILLRSAGFNHVDVKAAEDKIQVLRVPSYSPEAVAEFAMTMLMTVNRYTHKAYNRTREFNMSLHGLMGVDLYRKTPTPPNFPSTSPSISASVSISPPRDVLTRYAPFFIFPMVSALIRCFVSEVRGQCKEITSARSISSCTDTYSTSRFLFG